MRVSYTSLAVAALLFVAACGTNSPELTAPDTTSANTVAGDGGGIGMSGSGNSIATDPGKDGPGQIGSGNFIAAAGEGPGQIGSGNSIAPDSTFSSTAERGGLGLMGSGN